MRGQTVHAKLKQVCSLQVPGAIRRTNATTEQDVIYTTTIAMLHSSGEPHIMRTLPARQPTWQLPAGAEQSPAEGQ